MATGKSIRALSAKEDVSVSDLNDLVYTGIYEYSGSSSNKPSSNGGIVFCLFNWNNQGVQIARANHEQALRLRYNVAGTWTSWTLIMQNFTYVEKSVTVSFSAGTIGTRGYQTQFTAPAGKKLIGAVVTYLGDSSTCVPQLLSSSGTLYLNVYRATSSAVSNVKIDVRFTFADT